MSVYLVHILDDEQIRRGWRRLEVSNDADAIRQVRLFYPHYACELWEGERHVCRLEPSAAPRPPIEAR